MSVSVKSIIKLVTIIKSVATNPEEVKEAPHTKNTSIGLEDASIFLLLILSESS